VQLVRHNAWAEIRSAPAWFLEKCTRHLSVPVELGTEKGQRFGVLWNYAGQRYGSLVRGPTVPAGLAPHVETLARYYRIPLRTYDARERPIDGYPWHAVSADWRPYQERVHRELLHADRGVIDAPPRSGKTLMAARFVDCVALPTAWIAPSVQIVRQTYEVLVGFYGEEHVSRLDGSAKPHQKDPEKQIVVSTAASAAALANEWWDGRDVLVIDEFHHAAAETYHRINLLAQNVYYRIGWTGTHFRTGDDALAMEAVCSLKLAKVELGELIDAGFLAAPRVFFQRVRRSSNTGGHDWRVAYRRGIVECPERNDLVVRTAHALLGHGVPTIVLTRHRKHADELGACIEDAVVVKGGENALTSEAVRQFNAGRHQCLVGTTVIGEGVDVPRAAALVYASGGSDGVSMMQSYFRPLTGGANKPVGRIYDFSDRHHGTLSRHTDRRIAMARRELGAERVYVIE
jgi:superfamily II DNA or RNA helicase